MRGTWTIKRISYFFFKEMTYYNINTEYKELGYCSSHKTFTRIPTYTLTQNTLTHNKYITFIMEHEMHSRMHPNQGHVPIMFAHDLLLHSDCLTVIYICPVASSSPKKIWLVGMANIYTQMLDSHRL